ncbi:MAG: glycosyltransferase family 1 protein [Ignavibacteriales bacterium]|jgi:glycosyltransferase involved in cell wall biosynthesis|nr:glycosyltransferase family 4 protein [Melioribacteraceae bacterium]RJP57677.1 MAG: glycosyltransferase family 1 protein [Ignavibacteriales bacterium]
MKIGIDARVLDRKMTGVGRYLKNLIDGIPKIDLENEYYVFINDETLIDTKFYKRIPVKDSWLPDKIYSALWLNFILPSEIKKYKIDVFFTCNILLPFLKIRKTKTITVVHDIIQKAKKEFYPISYRIYLGILLPITFRNADVIITASEFSKSDIVRFYPITKAKLQVIYTSAEKKFQQRHLSTAEKADLHTKYNLPRKFLLYVGVIEKRKNISGLFEIANKLENDNITIPIVVIGRQGFGYSDIQQRAENSNGKIIYINFVSDEDLPKIYNLAYLFLFPSFYEGFGIPPIEAMQSGIPVISSDTTSLPEVLGDAAVLLPPNNIDRFVEEIKKMFSDSKYYEEYKLKGLEHARKYDYIKSSKQFVNTINKLK